MGIEVLELSVLLGDCMRKAEQRDEKRNKSEFAEWFKVCRHFFPDLPKWFNSISDPRCQPYVTYSQAVLLTMCIMKNVSGTVTMRGMNTAFNEDAAIANLGFMAEEKELSEMPDWQTVNNYLEKIDNKEIENIRRKMIFILLRSKHFDRYKFMKCWKIILDGTGIAYFKERHCEHDLVTKKTDPGTGKTTLMYYHKVLEAKIVLAPNVVLSIDTEFIENEDENVSKQDCELKAAERMMVRIKKAYPRLPICILGDGLYATMPFMKMCRENGWHYILNLKDGRQKTIADDFKILVETEGYQRIKQGLCGAEMGQGAFRNHMEQVSGKDQPCNVFEYRHKVMEKGVEKEVRFVWVTDMAIKMETLENFIYVGRDRWKIENEGFNNQKNGIYKIEHLCSREPNAMKAHYLMTQLSDIVMQLYLAFGVILGSIKRPIKSVAQKIGEHFWGLFLTQKDVKIISKRTALRLNTW